MADFRLEMLKQVAAGLAAQFGDNCEVLIHDLTSGVAQSSIVYIENGHVTGRKLGDGPSGAVLDALKHHEGPLKDNLAYLTKTESGRILKSSTIYIHDESDRPRYILSINFDITNLLALESTLRSLTTCGTQEDSDSKENAPRMITHDVNTLLDELIEQSVALVGVPVPLMSKEDKIKAINFLNDTGAFLITKSGDKVAKYFGISKYTLYSYVDINK
ncbi:MAG: helix-turn-helix transcriptional regulator [Bariatricus sp.]|nr:helix-turn-helix transcriptional regulator [Bariatricus sp.]